MELHVAEADTETIETSLVLRSVGYQAIESLPGFSYRLNTEIGKDLQKACPGRASGATLIPPGPELRLLVSLAAWTWPGTGPGGQEIAHILITHTPARTGPSTAETVEVRMRRLSGALGGLVGAQKVVPELERCLQVVSDQVQVHFPGVTRHLRLPAHRSWTELVARTGEAILLIGLDPLPQSADAGRLDAYLDAAFADDRLLFGRARTR